MEVDDTSGLHAHVSGAFHRGIITKQRVWPGPHHSKLIDSVAWKTPPSGGKGEADRPQKRPWCRSRSWAPQHIGPGIATPITSPCNGPLNLQVAR
jgi:hypothetical protein